MKVEENNGERPLYPITIEDNGNTTVTYLGLTKREHFAGLAMHGLLAKEGVWSSDEILAQRSIEIADEILKQLEK